jgi:integrase
MSNPITTPGAKPVPGRRISVKKYEGVFYTEREHLYQGRYDRTFCWCWQEGNKKRWRTGGRLSEGYTALDAYNARLEAIRLYRSGLSTTSAPASAPYTVPEALQDWLQTLTIVNGQPAQSSLSFVNLFSQRFDCPLSALSVDQLDTFKAELIARDLAPATVNFYFSLFKAAINLAIRRKKWLGLNPVTRNAGFVTLTVDNKSERWLSQEEAKLLLDTLAKLNPLIHDMAFVSLSTGMRLTELYRLKGQDLHPESGTAIVLAKGRKRQPVVITPDAMAILQARYAGPDQLIFRSRTGKKLNILHGFTKAVDLIGFNEGVTDRRHRVWFHTLRHTFASWLAQNKVTLYEIQKLMRHASVTMTERYAHLQPTTFHQQLEVISSLLPPLNT